MATPDSAVSLEGKLTAATRAERLANAHTLAKHYVLAAAGTALIPVPLADLGALMALQVKLVHGLTTLYAVPFRDNLARSLVASLLSGASWKLGALALSSLAKAVPGLGGLAGGGGMAVVSASVTYAVGEVFIRHFEASGSLLDFDPAKMKASFLFELRNGQAEAHAPTEAPDEASAKTPDEASVPAPTGEAIAETLASPLLPDTHETGQSIPYAPPGGDPLEDIVGIGEVFAGRLRAAGIGSFAELAASSPERIRQIVGHRAPLSGEPISSWIKQADDLARGWHPQGLPPKPKHKETTQ